jgi:hypothetical protein
MSVGGRGCMARSQEALVLGKFLVIVAHMSGRKG